MTKYLYKGKSFIMPSGLFDPFRDSWYECSNCHEFLFEKHCVSKIPKRCPRCDEKLKYIIVDVKAAKIFLEKGEIESVRNVDDN